jgi:hypothetical protein
MENSILADRAPELVTILLILLAVLSLMWKMWRSGQDMIQHWMSRYETVELEQSRLLNEMALNNQRHDQSTHNYLHRILENQMTVKMQSSDPIYRIPDMELMPTAVSMTAAESRDWGHQVLDLEAIHQITQGEDVKVAILDTGCDLEHPDLKDRIFIARNFTNSNVGPRDIAFSPIEEVFSKIKNELCRELLTIGELESAFRQSFDWISIDGGQ